MSGRPNNDSMYQQGNAARQNEYFVPRDGISREVITADICRYLGNDALVRPGTHTDDNGRVIQGYFITAYRNLTSPMIDDLKNDSARWEAERRKSGAGTPGISFRDWSDGRARRPNSPPVRYTDSQTREGPQRSLGSAGAGYGMQPEYGAPARDYDNGPRYPGSSAPGYSAASYSPSGAVGGYPGGQYQQGLPSQPQYGAAPQVGLQDPRYGGPSAPAGGPVPGYSVGNAQLAPEGYSAGSHYSVAPARDMYPMDMAMSDAPAAPIRRTSPPGAGPAAFGANPVGGVRTGYSGASSGVYGGFPQSVPSGSGAYAQPMDNKYGRAPTVPATGFNPPAHDMQSQPAQQYEDPAFPSSPSRTGSVATNVQTQPPSSSAPTSGSRRDHRDRDRHDRMPDRDRERDRDPTPPNRTGSAAKNSTNAHHHYSSRR